jgi:hypothetical protein
MGIYTHTYRDDEAEAVAALPDLSIPVHGALKATGTGPSAVVQGVAQTRSAPTSRVVTTRRKEAGETAEGETQKRPAEPSVLHDPSQDVAVVGAAGFEPAKAEPSDLQSDPFVHFGTRPARSRERGGE